MTQKLHNPFIVGDWIKRDADFIGREDLIQKYLTLERQFYWLIGARRMGKTSLLRYLQRQFQQRPDTLPLFWDVSGANTAYDLKLSFLDCLEAVKTDFEPKGFEIPIEKLENEAFLDMLRWLIREASRKATKLIFLIDESEGLFKVATHDPRFIQRFKAVVLNHSSLCVFLASNHRLAPYDSLNSDHLIAPLLQAFLPPDYLTPWTIAEARQLISKCLDQSAEQDQIIQYTGCLPFLVQMICFYYHDIGSLSQTFEHINQGNILDLFFRDDFHQLQPTNCDILAAITAAEPISVYSLAHSRHLSVPQMEGYLTALNLLGFVSRDENKNYQINNYFLKMWIQQQYLQTYHRSQPDHDEKRPADLPREIVVTLADQLVKLSLYEGAKNILVDQVRPAPEPSKYLNTDVHDLKGVKIIGQQLFHAIFGAFNDPAIQDFLGPDDQATDLILVEHAQQSHWIPFEYLHNGRQFLVLKYALFRTKNKNLLAQQQPPLFDQPLKILLFASNTPPEIDQVDNEITILRDQFHKIARELQMEFDITAIPSHEADYLTWQNLLQTNEFQIIHYAGHCGSDENAAASYLYFWEQAGNRGRVQAIAAPDFTKMLNKNLLLFYLNTCHSALPHSALPHQNYSHFANAILAAGAKAFMGNATAVNDRFSAEFARDFYWQLFSGHFNLAKALQITRLKWSQQTRYQESGHLFWLSPVLWQN